VMENNAATLGFAVGSMVTIITDPLGSLLSPINGNQYVVTTSGGGLNSFIIITVPTIGAPIVPYNTGTPAQASLSATGGGLVGDPNSVLFVDDMDSTAIPGDLLLTQQFGPPTIPAIQNLAMTETGWLVASGYNTDAGSSDVQVSERFLWHAWPMQNMVQITDRITDSVAFYDDVFFGTLNRPYHMRVAFSDNVEIESLDLTVRPYPDFYACTPNSMVATNFGAMYASPDGLVSLEANENAIISKRVTNPGDQLLNPIVPIRMNSVLSAAWWNGFYIGFCSGVAYLFNVENNHNNQFPLGQLITMDTPAGIPGANIIIGISGYTGYNGGIFALWGNQCYTLPLPGYGYETATLSTYTWKSKQFTLPGITTMAAAKVVADYTIGSTTFYLYGDGNLIYTFTPTTDKPFRLPHNHACINWEIELVGSAAIKEVHVATSMRDLIEELGET